MSQSTDTTVVLPVTGPNPAPAAEGEQTVTLPVVPLAAAPQAQPQPTFDPDRSRALHAHRVLERILATSFLPLPKVWEGHAYSSPMLDLTLLDGGAEALAAYQRVFGGQLVTEQIAAHDSAAGFPVPAQEYAHLATVIEGVDVVVSCWTPIPEPTAVTEAEPVEQPPTAPPDAATDAPAAAIPVTDTAVAS